MKGNRWLFVLSGLGAILGLGAAAYYAQQKPPSPPLFAPATNPFRTGIYANGIVESQQDSGANVNINPEVTGTVVRIIVREGQEVHQGDPLLAVEDSVQRAIVAQQVAQADAADAQLAQLQAQPRREVLEVAQAQVEAAAASLKTVQDQYDKLRKSVQLDVRSVSQDALDNSANAVNVSRRALEVAQRQLALTRAGAWSYDIRNQERQRDALRKAAMAADALLQKYVVRAPMDGVVLAVNTSIGAYVSPQGTYGTYTQGNLPALVMSAHQEYLAVRVYVDEILVHRLTIEHGVQARMFVRGTDVSLPLEFVRVQPYLTPKIELSDQRTERVDVRVLPVVFRFRRPPQPTIYPGQLVDVYLGGAS